MKPVRAKLSNSSKALLLGLAAATSATLIVEAHATVLDPLQVIYLFSGARDDGGGASDGVATSVHCTSFSGVSETLQFQARDFNGTIKGNQTGAIGSSQTVTASTHAAFLYNNNIVLNTGSLSQGTVGVLATSINIVCTAQVLDAGSNRPNGFTLNGTRFNPIPGTQE